jgi:hypothetical protein
MRDGDIIRRGGLPHTAAFVLLLYGGARVEVRALCLNDQTVVCEGEGRIVAQLCEDFVEQIEKL